MQYGKRFNEKESIVQILRGAGTGAMTVTLDNADVVDATGGVVTIPATGHGLKVGTPIVITGSTAYDGLYEILAVAANTFNITATYTAETLAGTETAQVVIGMIKDAKPWYFEGLELHLSAAAASAENFTATLDASAGAYYDAVLLTQAMSGVANVIWKEEPPYTVRAKTDLIRLAYTNTDARTWGFTAFVRKEI